MEDNDMSEAALRDMLDKALVMADTLGHTLTAIRIAEAIDETMVTSNSPSDD